MMQKIAPLTKLILAIAVSVWALLLGTVPALGILVAAQILLLILSRVAGKTAKAVISLLFFAVLLAGLQYALGSSVELAMIIGLRMTAMALIFIVVLATTRMQDLASTLVTQCRVPYEYAFMFTAALRFVPDFLAESKAVQEAQACRGYTPQGNVFKRMLSYAAIVEPLVLRAISKSETMALSLELRGFGSTRRSFLSSVALKATDYILLAGMAALTVAMVLMPK